MITGGQGAVNYIRRSFYYIYYIGTHIYNTYLYKRQLAMNLFIPLAIILLYIVCATGVKTANDHCILS